MPPRLPPGLSLRERQVMDALYRLHRATVAELVEAIPEEVSYSAVRAVLRVLREKGHVCWREKGPRYVYRPSVPREQARSGALEHLVRTFFDGSPAEAAAALLEMADDDEETMTGDDMKTETLESDQRRPGAQRRIRTGLAVLGTAWLVTFQPAAAQESLLREAPVETREPQVIDLTLERMVEYAMENSYRIRQVYLNIQRTRHRLRAERAGLKSRVFMNVSAPELQSVSQPRWNSDLQRNEIIHENSRRWEAQLSVRQPVMLFGYPTNGYLSLNNRMYRYLQLGEEDGERDLRYYNRYFVRYEQPLFQPNSLKNNLEEAELDLESSEMDFQQDVVSLVDDLSGDYFELFEDAYEGQVYDEHVANLEAAVAAAEALAATDTARVVEAGQIRVELANAREQAQQSRSQFRLAAARIRQDLQFPEGDSIVLDPVLALEPVQIDEAEAVRYATNLTPRLRRLDISYRENEIGLEETRSRGAFRMDVELSYGREVSDERFQNLWTEPTSSYTVGVNAYIPIWDWGERSQRVAASRVGLEQTQLRIDEARGQIVSNVQNEIRNLEEYESRAINMQQNLGLARDLSQASLGRYREGSITALDLLQSFRRELDTANNLLDAYLGWRRSLLRVQEMTYYDFETDMPVLDRFEIELPVGMQSTGS